MLATEGVSPEVSAVADDEVVRDGINVVAAGLVIGGELVNSAVVLCGASVASLFTDWSVVVAVVVTTSADRKTSSATVLLVSRTDIEVATVVNERAESASVVVATVLASVVFATSLAGIVDTTVLTGIVVTRYLQVS
jgi:hypothetical protein